MTSLDDSDTPATCLHFKMIPVDTMYSEKVQRNKRKQQNRLHRTEPTKGKEKARD